MSMYPYLPEQPQSSRSPISVPVVPMPDSTRWEYRRVERSLRDEGAPTEADLNALGMDGWELAGLHRDGDRFYLYLKRLA